MQDVVILSPSNSRKTSRGADGFRGNYEVSVLMVIINEYIYEEY